MIGKMRTRIKLIQKEYAPDTIGGHVVTNQEVKELFALVEEVPGTLAFQFAQRYNTYPLQVTIRWNVDQKDSDGAFNLSFNDSYDRVGLLKYLVTTDDLIEYEGDLYTIHAITKDQKKRWLQLLMYRKQ